MASELRMNGVSLETDLGRNLPHLSWRTASASSRSLSISSSTPNAPPQNPPNDAPVDPDLQPGNGGDRRHRQRRGQRPAASLRRIIPKIFEPFFSRENGRIGDGAFDLPDYHRKPRRQQSVRKTGRSVRSRILVCPSLRNRRSNRITKRCQNPDHAFTSSMTTRP